MSEPNCRRRVSECIFFDALSSPPAPPAVGLPPVSAPPLALNEPDGDRVVIVLVTVVVVVVLVVVAAAAVLADAELSERLTTGDSGISCSWGWG